MINAPGNFELLVATGSNTPQSIFNLLGFVGVSDFTGGNSYTGNAPSGKQYITQTELKNFSDFNKNKSKLDSVKRTTPGNIIETISYGTIELMSCEFPFLTNEVPQKFIRESATGLDEVEDFMDYLIATRPVEFLQDYKNLNVFTPCILEKSQGYSKGDGYKLNHLVTKRLKDYYSIKGLVFRKIEV